MEKIDVKFILNLIREIGFFASDNSLVPYEFHYEGYVFSRTYNINDVRAYFSLRKTGTYLKFLDEETDLNIVYSVLKNEFKYELRKIKITKFLNGSK